MVLQSDKKNTWLGLEDIPFPDVEYVAVERMQEENMEAKLGWELNLWLHWMVERLQ